MTATGVDAGAVLPLPSCPFRLAPQQIALPSARAQVWLFPAASSVAPETPLMRIGTFDAAPAAGSAICPNSLLPQQATAPVDVSAQVCCPPEVTPRRTTTRAASGGGLVWAGGVTAGGCDSAGGLFATAGGGAGGAGTVTVTMALAFSAVAVIVAEPARVAVTSPVGETPTIDGSLVAQVTSRSRIVAPRASLSVTEIWLDLPAASVSDWRR